MKSGNAAILGHAREGRALRLFLGTKGRVAYEGDFELAPDRPFYTTDAPEARNGPIRNVIVFRLRPVSLPPKPGSSTLDRVARAGTQDVAVEDVAVDEQWTEMAFVAPGHEASDAERTEQALVVAFRDHLIAQGHEVSRLKIVPPGEAKPLFADLFDRSTNTLFEAKGTVERGSIRMAVGQLLDYRRFLDPAPRLTVLLPTEPREDLRGLLQSAGVDVVWRRGKKFVDSGGGG